MKVIKFIISLAIPLLAGYIGSLLTTPGILSWYAFLNKPFLTPPNWIFAPVWTLLFVLMGISLYLVWIQKGNRRLYFILFGLQLALNVLWSFIFFFIHLPSWAFFDLSCLLVVIIALIIAAVRYSRAAAWLLLPYFIWSLFAGYLNLNIWLINRA